MGRSSSLSVVGGERRLPNFLYIGGARSGSTWLYQVLREHPDVYVPLAKNVLFYDLNYDKGLDWYASYFRDWRTEKAGGELSHNYFLEESIARNIYETLPNVRLICCLREPVDKALSDYWYNSNVTMEIDPRRYKDFADFIRLPEVAHTMRYETLLEPFFRLFGSERILVLFFDELKASPEDYVRRVYSFLDVDPKVRPPSLHTVVNAARKARSKKLSWFVKKTGEAIRAVGLGNVVGVVKHNPAFIKLFYSPDGKKPAVDPAVLRDARTQLPRRFAELENLIGRRVPDGWK